MLNPANGLPPSCPSVKLCNTVKVCACAAWTASTVRASTVANTRAALAIRRPARKRFPHCRWFSIPSPCKNFRACSAGSHAAEPVQARWNLTVSRGANDAALVAAACTFEASRGVPQRPTLLPDESLTCVGQKLAELEDIGQI